MTSPADLFRQAWHRADAEGLTGQRVEAGLEAAMAPILAERDELADIRRRENAGALRLADLLREHDLGQGDVPKPMYVYLVEDVLPALLADREWLHVVLSSDSISPLVNNVEAARRALPHLAERTPAR